MAQRLRPRLRARRPNGAAAGAEEIAQHPTAGERQLEMELIKPPHESEIRFVDGFRGVIHGGPRQPEELRLARDGQRR